MGQCDGKSKAQPSQRSMKSGKGEYFCSNGDCKKFKPGEADCISKNQIPNVKDKEHQHSQCLDKQTNNVEDPANKQKHSISCKSHDKDCRIPTSVKSISHPNVKIKTMDGKNPLIISFGQLHSDSNQQRTKTDIGSRTLMKNGNGVKVKYISNSKTSSSDSIIESSYNYFNSSTFKNKVLSKKRRETFDLNDKMEDLMACNEIMEGKVVCAEGICEDKQQSISTTQSGTNLDYLAIQDCFENMKTPTMQSISNIHGGIGLPPNVHGWKHRCHGSFSRIWYPDMTPNTRGMITLRKINLLKFIETSTDLDLVLRRQKDVLADFTHSPSQSTVHSQLRPVLSETYANLRKPSTCTLLQKDNCHHSHCLSVFPSCSIATSSSSSCVINHETFPRPLNTSNHERATKMLPSKKKSMSGSVNKVGMSDTEHLNADFSFTSEALNPLTFHNSFHPSVFGTESSRETSSVASQATEIFETDKSSNGRRNWISSTRNASLLLEFDDLCSTPYSSLKKMRTRPLSIGNVSLPSFEDYSFSPVVSSSSFLETFLNEKNDKDEGKSFSESTNATYVICNSSSLQICEDQGHVGEPYCQENNVRTQISETHIQDRNIATKTKRTCFSPNLCLETNERKKHLKTLEGGNSENCYKKLNKKVFRNRNAGAAKNESSELENCNLNEATKTLGLNHEQGSFPVRKKKAEETIQCDDKKLQKICASQDGLVNLQETNGNAQNEMKSSVSLNLRNGKKRQQNLKQHICEETRTVKSKRCKKDLTGTKSRPKSPLITNSDSAMLSRGCQDVVRILRSKKCQAFEQNEVTHPPKNVSEETSNNMGETKESKPKARDASSKQIPLLKKIHKTVNETSICLSSATALGDSGKGRSKFRITSGTQAIVETCGSSEGKLDAAERIETNNKSGKRGSRNIPSTSSTKCCKVVKDTNLGIYKLGQTLCPSKLERECNLYEQLNKGGQVPKEPSEKNGKRNKKKKISCKVGHDDVLSSRRTRAKGKNPVNESVFDVPSVSELGSFVFNYNISSSVCQNQLQPPISESGNTGRKLKDQKTSILLDDNNTKESGSNLTKQKKVISSSDDKKTLAGKSKPITQDPRKVVSEKNKTLGEKTSLKVLKDKGISCDEKKTLKKKNKQEEEKLVLLEDKKRTARKRVQQGREKEEQKEPKIPMRELRKRKKDSETSNDHPSDQAKVSKTPGTIYTEDPVSKHLVSKAKNSIRNRKLKKADTLTKSDKAKEEQKRTELDKNGATGESKLDNLVDKETKTSIGAKARKQRIQKSTKTLSRTEVDQEELVKESHRKTEEVKEGSQKYIGAHCSIAGGISNAVTEAVSLGARAFALFVRNGRTWKLNPLDENEAEKFQSACKIHGFSPHLIIPHGSYLLNCGSSNPDTLKKSRDTLVHELQICEKLGLTLYNFHPGSACGKGTVSECIQTIADSINLAHKETKFVKTVIENMSCQGQTVGGKFEELKAIIDKVKDKSRIGVCLDTCHAFAAGFDLSSQTGFTKFMDDFESIVGFKYLCALHLNDSKGELGCHLDRHENIGKGHIGIEGFRRVMNDLRLNNIPMILETPVNNYAKEIQTLCQLESL